MQLLTQTVSPSACHVYVVSTVVIQPFQINLNVSDIIFSLLKKLNLPSHSSHFSITIPVFNHCFSSIDSIYSVQRRKLFHFIIHWVQIYIY